MLRHWLFLDDPEQTWNLIGQLKGGKKMDAHIGLDKHLVHFIDTQVESA